MSEKKVTVLKDGPYLVSGGLPLAKEIAEVGSSGEPETWKKGKEYPKQESYILCRCGRSGTKPYCDGMHAKVGFDGTETASRRRYLSQARRMSGPELDLTDAERLCSLARFCHLGKGTWSSVMNSDDPELKRLAIQTSCNCPSGRLVAWDKAGKSIEPEFEPSISVVEDPQLKVSGPLWLKGNVPVESSEGKPFETRNRVTLCRCGNSRNKPYCDGSHIRTKFNDGDESLK